MLAVFFLWWVPFQKMPSLFRSILVLKFSVNDLPQNCWVSPADDMIVLHKHPGLVVSLGHICGVEGFELWQMLREPMYRAEENAVSKVTFLQNISQLTNMSPCRATCQNNKGETQLQASCPVYIAHQIVTGSNEGSAFSVKAAFKLLLLPRQLLS